MSAGALLRHTRQTIHKVESPFLQDRLQVGRFDAFRDQPRVQGARGVIGFDELFVFRSQARELRNDDVLGTRCDGQHFATIYLDFLMDNPLGPILRQSRGILVDSVNIKAVLLVEGRAFAEQSIDLFGSFRLVVRVQILLCDFPDFCISGICVDFARSSEYHWRVRPGEQDALTSDDEDLICFEQPRDCLDRFDEVFKGADERWFGFHALSRGRSARLYVVDLTAIRFAARQIRRLNASSSKSMPSVTTNGDDSRNRVIASSRLVRSRRTRGTGRSRTSFHSRMNE